MGFVALQYTVSAGISKYSGHVSIQHKYIHASNFSGQNVIGELFPWSQVDN